MSSLNSNIDFHKSNELETINIFPQLWYIFLETHY